MYVLGSSVSVCERHQKQTARMNSENINKLSSAGVSEVTSFPWGDDVQGGLETRSWQLDQVLTNHVILERIAAACKVNHLKVFRQVCRSWYVASLPQWYNSATIVLHGWLLHNEFRIDGYYYHEFPVDKDMVEDVPQLGICELEEKMREIRVMFGLQEDMHHFRNYKIVYGRPFAKDVMNRKTLDFWAKFGPNMTTLCLENFYARPVEIDAILKDFAPYLKSLELSNYYEIGTDRISSRQLPANIKKLILKGLLLVDNGSLLNGCSHLEELHVYGFLPTKFLRSHGRMLAPAYPELIIACLEWDCSDRERFMDPFGEYRQILSYRAFQIANIPCLKSLSISFEKNVDEEAAGEILNRYASSLQRLTVSRYPMLDCAPYQNFPCTEVTYPNLTFLELQGNITDNFQFLRLMPSLKKLVVDRLCFGRVPYIPYGKLHGHAFHHKWDITMACVGYYLFVKYFQDPSQYYGPCEWQPLTDSQLQMTTDVKPFVMLSLEHFEMDYEFDVGSLSVLHQWLPNVKVLKTILKNEELRSVCKSWTRLSHLKLLLGSKVDDHGITGVDGDNYLVEPNLTDLKDLQTFELDICCGEGTLTDKAAEMAFLQMRLLETLIIPSTMFSEAMIDKLHANINYVRVCTNAAFACTGKTKDCCCERATFLRKITTKNENFSDNRIEITQEVVDRMGIILNHVD